MRSIGSPTGVPKENGEMPVNHRSLIDITNFKEIGEIQGDMLSYLSFKRSISLPRTLTLVVLRKIRMDDVIRLRLVSVPHHVVSDTPGRTLHKMKQESRNDVDGSPIAKLELLLRLLDVG